MRRDFTIGLFLAFEQIWHTAWVTMPRLVLTAMQGVSTARLALQEHTRPAMQPY